MYIALALRNKIQPSQAAAWITLLSHSSLTSADTLHTPHSTLHSQGWCLLAPVQFSVHVLWMQSAFIFYCLQSIWPLLLFNQFECLFDSASPTLAQPSPAQPTLGWPVPWANPLTEEIYQPGGTLMKYNYLFTHGSIDIARYSYDFNNINRQ